MGIQANEVGKGITGWKFGSTGSFLVRALPPLLTATGYSDGERALSLRYRIEIV